MKRRPPHCEPRTIVEEVNVSKGAAASKIELRAVKYVVHHSDVRANKTLDRIACRFGYDGPVVYATSRRAGDKRALNAKSADALSAALVQGDTLHVPLRDGDRAMMWQLYSVTEKTLGEFCDELSKEPARKGAIAVTPAFLWTHPLNSEFRSACIGADDHDDWDESPDKAVIHKNNPHLFVPRPARPQAPPIAVAPKSECSPDPISATVYVASWKIRLHHLLGAVALMTTLLEEENDRADRIRVKHRVRGNALLAMIGAMEALVALYGPRDRPVDGLPDTKDVEAIGKRLRDFSTQIGPRLMTEPSLYVDAALDWRKRRGERLAELLRDEELLSLAERAHSPTDGDDEELKSRIAQVLYDATEALKRSPFHADVALKIGVSAYAAMESEAVPDEVGQVEPAYTRWGKVLAIRDFVDTVAGAAADIVSNSIGGQIPGAEVLVTAWANYRLAVSYPKLLQDPNRAKEAERLFDAWAKRLKLKEEDAAALREALKAPATAARNKAVAEFSASLHGSPRWTGFVLFFNALGLIASMNTLVNDEDEGNKVTAAVQVIDYMGNGFAAVQTLRALLNPETPFAKSFFSEASKYNPAFRYLNYVIAAAYIGVALGEIAVDVETNKSPWLHVVDLVEGIGLLGAALGSLWLIPTLTVAGTVVAVGAGVVRACADIDESADDLKAALTGPKRTLMSRLDGLGNDELYKAFMTANPDIKDEIVAIRSEWMRISCPSFYHYALRVDENIGVQLALAKFGYTADEITEMCS